MSAPRLKQPTRRMLQTDSGVLPLINVVFLLLIFFMIAGQIAEQAPFEVVPPASQAEGDVRRAEPLILLDAYGRAAVGGDEMPVEQVAAHLAAAWAAGRDATPAEVGDVPAGRAVRLRADEAADSATVIALIDALRKAGVERVTLMTEGAGR